MCDTFVALPGATVDGSVILAKNSDREPNEAHEVVLLPAAEHDDAEQVRCTYLDIPQVRRTHAVLLAKPYWIWGAEMGANEHGVVIGNEAVFTKVPHEKTDGLIGMDLLRLGLERAVTAEEAVGVITALLERHGQGGSCGHTSDLRYDNSFIVADGREAWVLETAGREWAAERVDRTRSISNAITLGRDADLVSSGLVRHAVDEGWSRSATQFDFARDYSDFLYTRFSDARARQCRTTDTLRAQQGRVDVASAVALLRDHGDVDRDWSPAKAPGGGLLGQTVCAHAGFGPVRISQSTGSWVSHLAPDGTFTHWVTATSAPCTSVFKPVWFDGGVPSTGPQPRGRYDASTLWWRHEDLHRATLADYARLHALYADELEHLEARFRVEAAAATTPEQRAEVTRTAYADADAAEQRWTATVRARAGRPSAPGLFGRAWRSFDKAAGRRS
ncbi:MAG: C69 family dipeptidase [Candidatus Nanopelagicales bacterium]